jgi:hypothetical protein
MPAKADAAASDDEPGPDARTELRDRVVGRLQRGRERIPDRIVTVDEFAAPTLRTGGMTALGTGLRQAVSMIRDRKQVYRDNGVNYYRPSIFLITDGEPTAHLEGRELVLMYPPSERTAREARPCRCRMKDAAS